LMLVALGPISATTSVLPGGDLWHIANPLLGNLGATLEVLIFLLFPSGQFVPHWTRWIFVLYLVSGFAANLVYPQPSGAQNLGYFYFVITAAVAAFLQIYRYRRVSTPMQRQQTKWVVFGFAAPVAILVILILSGFIYPPLSQPGSLYGLAIIGLGYLATPCLALAFGVAMLRYRLWEIDQLINRTLVYGFLTVLVVGAYILMVSIPGALMHTSSNALIPLLATGVVAVLLHPLQVRLQRLVNRLMYGERDDPYAVLTRLGSRLEATLVPEAVLPTIVETVAQALKVPYAAVALKHGDTFTSAASYGLPQDKLFILPVVYQTEVIGQLQLALRAPEEEFTAADRRLLTDIARQAGIAVHALRLTADLQHSRERLVTAREEERRRLRRDLHDGLGATLAAFHLQAGAIRSQMRHDLDAASAELLELQEGLRSAIADIRRLVYALRPPTLDELGLVGAIRQYATQYETPGTSTGSGAEGGLRVAVEAPEHLPDLPAAVEVAVYRIVQEALTNVVRHAGARTCTVLLTIADAFQLEISDDGAGFAAQSGAGVGLLSMRERAEEAGGFCLVESAPGRGTRIRVNLPFPKE
ncbi:MAG: GAF domain-containing sensor histidine kinase, partial [Chloroflexota bacterium]|nr:GAF domain-containing sensor histidine kinase [Chloroflexota bacterium]